MATICVSGVIGAGKTTFIDRVAKELCADTYLENVEDPLLPLMYEDPKRWAFSLQMSLLNDKFNTMQDANRDKTNAIIERTIYEDKVFSYNHYLLDNFTRNEWKLYNKIYETYVSQLAPPDLMIFLSIPDELSLERIADRNRYFEQDPALKQYYLKLNKEYRRFYEEYPYPKLQINNEAIDVKNRQDDLDYVVSKITSVLTCSTSRYFHP
jgi:deoxyadenosine/deoxycytidine kinase